jgi:hypothetical protein
VTLSRRANSPQMRDFEDKVAGRVRAGEIIEYMAKPIYSEGILPPSGVLLTGFGNYGPPIARLIRNPAGRRP